ncbi:MAG: SpoIVB peptidase S55 domain-containing protein [Bacilli bacterium]|nr:SpoIVB peptidase S55 domain-containing protein [Bacilli bacterium]
MKKKIITLFIIVFLFPISSILADSSLILGGDSIGVEGEYNGVYVSGTYQFNIKEEIVKPENSIKPHDLITQVNNHTISDLTTFKMEVAEYTELRNEIPITIIRDKNKMNIILISSFTNEGAQYGLYLKEKVLGIGTLTFYNPTTKEYGALGHSISESGNENLQSGKIYNAAISNVKKAEENNPGEKNGNINYESEIGNIDKNINFGIYGNYYNDIQDKEMMDTASLEEITLGKAQFYTTIEGNEVEAFEIEITNVNKDNISDEKGISFTVTDQKLIEKCGGIIHGMSGSPIVQNNKIIGAITHVKVEDPLSGYGIFINNMVKQTQK